MVLNIQSKQDIVAKINKITKSALSAVVADFRGVSVNKMTELRKACREADVCVYITRNTLLYKAVKGTVFECLQDTFIGPTVIAYSMKNPNTAARLFKEFMKVDIRFIIKAAAFKGKLIPASQIDLLATLPTYEEAIIHLITVIKEISILRLIRTLSAVYHIKKFT